MKWIYCFVIGFLNKEKIKKPFLMSSEDLSDILDPSNITSIINKRINRELNIGADIRTPINTTKVDIEMKKIKRFFNLQKILHLLESNISLHEKEIISEDILDIKNNYGVNIKAGGLFDDWDFKI